MASLLGTESKLRPESLKQANEHTCKLLLNCYIRELGHERRRHIDLNARTLDYAVVFPASGITVFGKLAYYSAAGEHEYHSMRWLGGSEEGAVGYEELVRWIVGELTENEGPLTGGLWITVEKKRSFVEQVGNSCRNLALFIERAAEHGVFDYRSSEQALIYGHPFHPFPKNMSGFTERDVLLYSPELRSSFRLSYFAVRRDVYREEWVSEGGKVPPYESVQDHLGHVLGGQSGEYAPLPVHPWQYRHVLGLAKVREYIRDGKLIPLGSLGPLAYPTTSVRTVYIPEMNCNIKLPLNMQITNLVRTNSGEQMRRTLDASRYLLRRGGFGPDSPAGIAYETGIGTCRFEEEELTRQFTVVYRPIEFDPSCTYVLASLVEAPRPGKPSRLMTLLGGGEVPIERWFERYLELSMLPIVRLAGEQGIHFEAHLQNTLLTVQGGMPAAFIIRDLEGVSVEIDKAHANEEEAPSPPGPLFYPREEAWKRTGYYFFVNHLGLLIHSIARDVNASEEQFWGIARDMLMREYARSANPFAKHLLTAETFRAKRNMLSCLAGNGETPSYVEVNNLLRREGEPCGDYDPFA
ncbi:IucA/IucC family protein [Paenibacillus barengoltzii]|uniref:IucA/IucC family protein n=1 Tax=Paenibacillus barengoltzii TaxID=343517 RepID=UPI001FCBC55E|nr:IucA/IucC family protein [Paenibacillus barengoltzii]